MAYYGANMRSAMKTIKVLTGTLLAAAVFCGALAAVAADKAPAGKTPTDKVKPYTLKYCVVSGDKLGEMGKAYVFTNDNREIKLCCKSCLKDFKKDPAKYVKKIEQAEAKEKGKDKEKGGKS